MRSAKPRAWLVRERKPLRSCQGPLPSWWPGFRHPSPRQQRRRTLYDLKAVGGDGGEDKVVAVEEGREGDEGEGEHSKSDAVGEALVGKEDVAGKVVDTAEVQGSRLHW